MTASIRSRRHVVGRDRPGAAAGRGERGTALVLVPTLTLVLFCLGAIAVDLSVVHAAHRQTHRVASSAAQDGASMIDERELQVSGDIVIDAERARRVALAHVTSADLPGELVDAEVVVGPDVVDVDLVLNVPRVVMPALPGRDETTRIVVAARGRLHR